MYRIVEVENLKTSERSTLSHPTLKKGDTITNAKGKWIVTRVYTRLEGSF